MIEVGHASHTGLQRECNEDSYWVDCGLGLFVVVDGIGGPGRGEIAAAIARDALVDAARGRRELEPAIRNAGATIAALASVNNRRAPTGATLASLQIGHGEFQVARIGDACAWLWQHGVLTPLCPGLPASPSDDTAEGAPEPAPTSHFRNRATQALGITPPAQLDAAPVRATLEHGMQFLLCTDGLSEVVDEPRIAATLARNDLAAQECVEHLLLAALDAGGRDNTTVLLVRVA